MITIKVGGTPLYIPKDTTLVLEQNNNIFNDDIMEDIVWTFDIPAKPNQKVLTGVQFNYIKNYKRYECELSFEGMVFATGTMYVQTASDEKTLSCGIVANSFNIGFGEKKLNENDYGEDIIISDTEAGHQAAWKSFLEGSLNANSIYKFFLFCCDKFYENNDDYGYHKDKVSGLTNTDNNKQWFKYVNRLFFSQNNVAYNNTDFSQQGVRLFNTADPGKQNGYCFCPAIRLDWLLKALLIANGIKALGGIFTDNKFKNFFIQSLCALDGDVFQYGVYTWLSINGNINLYSDTITGCQQFRTDSDNNTHTSFGWINNVTVGFRLLLPVDELVRHNTNISPSAAGWTFGAQFYDEIYAIAIMTADAQLPSMRMSLNTTEEDGTHAFKYGRPMTIAELKSMAGVSSSDTFSIDAIYSVGNTTGNVEYTVNASIFSHKKTLPLVHTTYSTLVQLTASEGKNVFFRGELGGYTEGSVLQRINNDVSSTTKQFLKLVKCRVGTARGSNIGTFWLPTTNKITLSDYGIMECIYNYEVLSDQAIDTTDTPLNIFSNVMRWRDHVPNMTNGEFLTRICQIFGLNLFTNPLNREVQFSFFKDTLLGKSFDISQWVTHSEKMEYTPTKYEVTVTPALGTKSVAEKNILEPVSNAGGLPGAFIHKNKHAFVENENAYRRSTQQEGTSTFKWDQAGGNDHKLTAGSPNPEKTEEVKIEANIPNMRMADEKITNTNPKYICEVPLTGCSPLLDEDYDGEFDLVIQQYKGRRLISMNNGTVASAFIEDANPTCYDENGNASDNYLTLAADGQNSIGQKWLKSVYDFKGNCENYRFTAKLPAWAFLRVYGLLKPQTGSPAQQERWLYVNGNKFIPTKISYEFGMGDKVIATIECAAQHYSV